MSGPDCVNFRDVGATLARLGAGKVLAAGRLYRGGTLERVSGVDEIGGTRTILNFHRTRDELSWFDGTQHHLPLPDRDSTYDPGDKRTRRWLRKALGLLESCPAPVFVHCRSGKDRTGVLVAALLTLFGLERRWITAEYLESDGVDDPRKIGRFLDSLDGAGLARRIDVPAIRKNLS